MKERRNKKPKFDPDQFKRDFIVSTNHDEEIHQFFKRGNSMLDRDLSDVGASYNRNSGVDNSHSYHNER